MVTNANPARPLRVGLLWHSTNSGNLGVGALTVANLALAREAAAARGLTAAFTIIGMQDPGPAYVSAPDVADYPLNGRRLVSPAGAWSVIGAQDCLLDIGLGDSFADIYGFKRFFYLWATKLQALARRRPLMLSPQTIGPFSGGLYRAMARLPLERADKVFARDDLSLRALEELAPRARGALAVDVAFALPFEDRSAQRGGPRVRVGLNVSGLLYKQALSGTNRFGMEIDYAEMTHELLAKLSVDPAYEVDLICHVVGGGEDDDRGIANQLAGRYPGVARVVSFEGPSEAKTYISGLDFLIAGRMHACIAAFSSGVPVVPVAYSRKFSGLFGSLDYPWLVPVTGSGTAAATAYVLDALDRRAEVAADVAEGMTRVGERLDVYRAALGAFFAGAAARLR